MAGGVNESVDVPRRRVRERSTGMAKAKLGSGKRFAALKGKLAGRKGVKNPGALAAYIGRKKYGAKRFARLSAKGRGK
jgi:hypothetical protein